MVHPGRSAARLRWNGRRRLAGRRRCVPRRRGSDHPHRTASGPRPPHDQNSHRIGAGHVGRGPAATVPCTVQVAGLGAALCGSRAAVLDPVHEIRTAVVGAGVIARRLGSHRRPHRRKRRSHPRRRPAPPPRMDHTLIHPGGGDRAGATPVHSDDGLAEYPRRRSLEVVRLHHTVAAIHARYRGGYLGWRSLWRPRHQLGSTQRGPCSRRRGGQGSQPALDGSFRFGLRLPDPGRRIGGAGHTGGSRAGRAPRSGGWTGVAGNPGVVRFLSPRRRRGANPGLHHFPARRVRAQLCRYRGGFLGPRRRHPRPVAPQGSGTVGEEPNSGGLVVLGLARTKAVVLASRAGR